MWWPNGSRGRSPPPRREPCGRRSGRRRTPGRTRTGIWLSTRNFPPGTRTVGTGSCGCPSGRYRNPPRGHMGRPGSSPREERGGSSARNRTHSTRTRSRVAVPPPAHMTPCGPVGRESRTCRRIHTWCHMRPTRTACAGSRYSNTPTGNPPSPAPGTADLPICR